MVFGNGGRNDQQKQKEVSRAGIQHKEGDVKAPQEQRLRHSMLSLMIIISLACCHEIRTVRHGFYKQAF